MNHKRVLVFLFCIAVCVYPLAAFAITGDCQTVGGEAITGLDLNHGVDRLMAPSQIGIGAMGSAPAPRLDGERGFLAMVGVDNNGKRHPMAWAYSHGDGLEAANLFNGSGYSPPALGDIQDIQVVVTKVPEGPEYGAQRINILTHSSDAARLISGDYYQGGGQISNWAEYQLNDSGPAASCSLAGKDAGQQSRASVFCSDDQGVSVWNIPNNVNIGGPIIKDRIWFFGSWEKTVKNKPVAFAYDNDLNLHGAGGTEDGCLAYTKWDQDGKALEGRQLGECGQDWKWVRAMTAGNGGLWVSAYNAVGGNLNIWEKLPGGDWAQTVISPIPGNTVGMHNSMGVEQASGIAHFTYAYSGGLTKTLYKAPGQPPKWTWMDEGYGQAVSTSTSAGQQVVNYWWLSRIPGQDNTQVYCRTCAEQ